MRGGRSLKRKREAKATAKNPPHQFGKFIIPPKAIIKDSGVVRENWPERPTPSGDDTDGQQKRRL